MFNDTARRMLADMAEHAAARGSTAMIDALERVPVVMPDLSELRLRAAGVLIAEGVLDLIVSSVAGVLLASAGLEPKEPHVSAMHRMILERALQRVERQAAAGMFRRAAAHLGREGRGSR